MAVRVLVSACLIGVRCAYDGFHRESKQLKNELEIEKTEVIAFCPELFVFGVPRDPIEIKGGDGKDFLAGRAVIVGKSGQLWTLDDLSKKLEKIENWVKFLKPQKAYLKEKSPFCGVNVIYDGSFSGYLVKGKGVFAAILEKYDVHTEGVL